MRYGHPRRDVIELLNEHVERRRATVDVKVAVGQRRFENVTVKKAA